MPSKLIFNPKTEIPSLAEKVIVVTGGTAGLGRETVLSFAQHGPAKIFFTGRSQSSADKLIQEVKAQTPSANIEFVPCDLASLVAVQKAARSIISNSDRLDLIMANAGVMALPPGLTEDGYEIQFGTNHVGHCLLVKLLTPLLETTAALTDDVRVIWNTSEGYKAHPKGGILFDKLKTAQVDISPIMGEWMRYGQSKLANLLYARAYANHHPAITSVSLHPGVSATGLVNSLTWYQRLLVYATNVGNMISPEECAWNQQWAATAQIGTGERQLQSGRFYLPVGVETVPLYEGANDELAEKLYVWTEKELEAFRP